MSRAGRLSYVDWMRGLAVLLMFQTHAYDSWLTPLARQTSFYRWSRFAGGYPAVLFLFLAGLSLALVAEGRIAHGARPRAAALEGARRGAEVFGWGVLFRLSMFVTGGFAKPADLLRVDVLNCIGLSMAIVSLVCLGRSTARRRALAAVGVALGIALLTPLAWDLPWPPAIPRSFLAYVSGRVPGSVFPLFPWCAFAAAGAGAGPLLSKHRDGGGERRAMLALAAAGVAAAASSRIFDRLAPFYPRYDYWWTSPGYAAVKIGVVLLALVASWAWSQRPTAGNASPLRQLGRTSLLVYWVHLEIVYGGIVAPWARHGLGLTGASIGLVLLTAAMLALSIVRTRGLRPRTAAITAPIGG